MKKLIKGRKISRLVLCMSAACSTAGTVMVQPAAVVKANDITPLPADNYRMDGPAKSLLIPVSSGWERVFYSSDDKKIYVESYDQNFKIQSRQAIDLELPLFGTFYVGADGSRYIVEAQNNTEEVNGAEIMRVIRYDSAWKKIGSASIHDNPKVWGGEVRYPLDVTTLSVVEADQKLILAGGHEGYVDPEYGQGHQGLLLAKVDLNTMKGELVRGCDLWHSFSQHLAADSKNIYLLEESDGDRATTLNRLSLEPAIEDEIDILKYGGEVTSAWAISTFASANDILLLGNSILTFGTSIDQSRYNDSQAVSIYNLFASVTPKDSFKSQSTRINWLTNYSASGSYIRGVHAVKIDDQKAMVLWEPSNSRYYISSNGTDPLSANTICYALVNQNGDLISSVYTEHGALSNCHPVLHNGKISFFSSAYGTTNFYTIDVQSLKFSTAKAGTSEKSDTVQINTASVSGINAQYAYTGKAITPKPVLKIGSKTLAEGKDYKLSYSSNTNPGTATVTITGIGSYVGTVQKTFTIVKQDSQKPDSNPPASSTKSTKMHRLYNPNSGEHFYTAADNEKDHLVSVGWTYEGEGWKAPVQSNTPVYRLYNPNAGDHHYTLDQNEKDTLVKLGWKYEGIGWYSDDTKSVPLYRQYNPNAQAGSHNYTINKEENDELVKLGWKAEGIGWYGMK